MGRGPKAKGKKCGRPCRNIGADGDRKGKPCTREAGWGTDHVGEGACKLHGGSTPRGAASPHFKTGAHSKHWNSIGEELEKAITELASDPDYLSLRRHIAVLDNYLLQELRRSNTADAGAGWTVVREAAEQLLTALRSGDTATMASAIRAIREEADRGERREKAMERVSWLIKERVNATKADQRRVEGERAYATIEQLKAIAVMSATSVAERIDLFMRQVQASLDDRERMRLEQEFEALRRETIHGVSESVRTAIMTLPAGS